MHKTLAINLILFLLLQPFQRIDDVVIVDNIGLFLSFENDKGKGQYLFFRTTTFFFFSNQDNYLIN
jgi:hypothetical protein